MKILVIGDLASGLASYLSKKHDVELFSKYLDGHVKKTSSIKDGVLGKPDLIIFDGVGHGKLADGLAKEGFKVIGASEAGDKMDEAFVKKAFDVFDIRESKPGQKGVETSAEVWYSQGRIVPNPNSSIETYTLMDGNLGQPTEAQTSVVFSYPKKEPRIIQQTLRKISIYLQKTKYTGPVTIRGLVSKGKFYATRLRVGFEYPHTFALAELINQDFGQFLYDVASGAVSQIPYKAGYGLSMRVTIPPYPMTHKDPVIQRRMSEIAIGHKVSFKDCFYPYEIAQFATMGSIVGDIAVHALDLKEARKKAMSSLWGVDVLNKQARIDGVRMAERAFVDLEAQGYETPQVKFLRRVV